MASPSKIQNPFRSLKAGRKPSSSPITFGIVYMVWLFQAWLPGYLEIQRHMSIRTTGFVAAIPYACGVVGSIGAGWVTPIANVVSVSSIWTRSLSPSRASLAAS
jgi:hypothetical protein